MRVYIKSIDEKAWQRVLQGWSPPRRTDGEGDFLLKPETDWNAEETAASNMNNKALNPIFTSLDSNMFALVTNCVCAKQAWEKLQMHCEGSESVRRTKRRILTTQFENLRMEESETIDEYERCLRKIENEAIDLGDAISNERLVSKVLRSLPERFQMKICAIDESKDTSILSLDELMSSLRTYELDMNMGRKDKDKSIALQVSNDSYNDFVDLTQEVNESDLGDDSIDLLTKQFGNYLKRMRDSKKSGQKSKAPITPAVGRPLRIGFGHYANECPTRLRRGMNASLSNDEVEEGIELGEEETHNALTVLMQKKSSVVASVATLSHNTHRKQKCWNASVTEDLNNQDADEDELSLENVQKMYEELFADWVTRNKSNSALSKENSKLKAAVARLEVFLIKKDLELQVLSPVLPTLHQNTARKKNTEKNIWVPKAKSNCNVVYASLKTNVAGYWYFDSGSSRHMTGSKKYLADYVEQNKGKVTYGGGANGKIVGRGTL
ncbi:uncharacterized protein [Henckelia pumila]|uniref:uncharacterized protein n=1 Tax=Henckelia pumila TaxID=405737 RepID=UPI003C6E4B3B